jgi:SAM-dependent methyltransferase
VKTITECRACEGTDLESVLDLGNQPLANRFVTEEQCEWQEPDYPLHLVRCLTCGLAQLTVVVDPTILYGPNYAYRSGYSEGWRDHCSDLADEIGQQLTLDIGCLDGTLLTELFRRGVGAVGCDPSAPDSAYHPIARELFGRDSRIRGAPFDVIVAQNVFGHVDDAKGFLEGVAENLAPDGQCIIEVPWVVPMVCEGRWDTIYHEHLSYWGVTPLHVLANSIGLNVAALKHFPQIHGGTMRFTLQRQGTDRQIIYQFGAEGDEAQITDADWQRFGDRAYRDIRHWDEYLQNPQRKAIAAYGASAKLNTFLNALPQRPSIIGVFDDNPTKWNLYTPGWHLPVLKPTKMTMRETDVLLIGAPNWRNEIQDKAEAQGFAGEIVSLW